MSRKIQTVQDVQEVYNEAVASFNANNFADALALYDLMLDHEHLGFFNPWDVKTERAITLCKAGRYDEAEVACQEILTMLKDGGVPLGSSKAMYWFLVAKNKGDEKGAMDEYMKM